MKRIFRWLTVILAFTLLLGMWGCSSQPAQKAAEKPKVETAAVRASNTPMPAPINKPTSIKAAGTIEVAFSPRGGAADAIIRAIGEAKKTIRVQAYSFTNADIAKALLDATKKGVDVKVVLDKSQETEQYSSATFFENNKIPLRIDHDFAIAHSKLMIIDEENVITGSFNFTKSAEERNEENVLILRGNKELASLYLKNWQWRWDASEAYKRPPTKN